MQTMRSRVIFISHASADSALAKSLAKHIEAAGLDVKTYVASRPGDIRADTEWLASVQKGIRDADAYVILLTVNSVLRPWVNFETGAAWFSEKTCVLVKAGGLPPEDIPLPLSAKQVYALNRTNHVEAVFRALGLQAASVGDLVSPAVSFETEMKLAGHTEPVWEGLELEGTFYAWAGPLLDLEDKPGVPHPPQLLKLLEGRGMRVSFASPERLSHHCGRGRCQVFVTDKTKWRRPVLWGRRQLLLVRRPENVSDQAWAFSRQN